MFAEGCEVAGEGGWIAADVEDARNARVHEGVEEFAVAAFSRRVDDGNVGRGFLSGAILASQISALAVVKCASVKPLRCAACLGVGDSLADAVDAVERLAAAGDEAADGADAAVEVEHAG